MIGGTGTSFEILKETPLGVSLEFLCVLMTDMAIFFLSLSL